MKVTVLSLIILGQLATSNVFASGMPIDCSAKRISSTCFTFTTTAEASFFTRSSTDERQAREIFGPAAQGALSLRNAQSEEEQYRVIQDDQNLQNALGWLKNKGFQGTNAQAADAILSLVNQ